MKHSAYFNTFVVFGTTCLKSEDYETLSDSAPAPGCLFESYVNTWACWEVNGHLEFEFFAEHIIYPFNKMQKAIQQSSRHSS
jgi:hypothetical protein